MPDPERYVTVDELQDELPFAESAFDVGDWAGLLERLLDEESERVEGDDYAGTTFDDDVPGPIKDGVIRLVRSRLERIKSDGLDSESIGDQSVTYRPPAEIRADVQSMVRRFQPHDEDKNTGAFVV